MTDEKRTRHLLSRLDPRNLVNPKQLDEIKANPIPLGSEKVIGPVNKRAVDQLFTETPCGDGRFKITWGRAGDEKAVTVYCAEPLCRETGSCTGPRFVPHAAQFTYLGRPRRAGKDEKLMASKEAAAQAEKLTGVPETRSDKEIAAHIEVVRAKTIKALRERGSLQ